jgi:NAD-dependent SIR2 family protein deacetylase
MINNLAERLKYYHCYCVNCGNFLYKWDKKGDKFTKTIKCGDCKEETEIFFKMKYRVDRVLRILTGKNSLVVNCSFLLESDFRREIKDNELIIAYEK